jgi:hypothetical protein
LVRVSLPGPSIAMSSQPVKLAWRSRQDGEQPKSPLASAGNGTAKQAARAASETQRRRMTGTPGE